ncbi:MAG: PEP-CTERM sorting domain-containing protein, partial [Opitutales bacterium]
MRIWLLLCLGLATAVAPAVEIRIDYTYDTSNFFSTPERRAAIEAVARFFSELLEDELLEIDPADFTQASWIATFTHPATGARELIENPVIPANTIIEYVGARALSINTTGLAGPGAFSASG